MRLPETREIETLDKKFPRMSSDVLDIQKVGLATHLSNTHFCDFCPPLLYM